MPTMAKMKQRGLKEEAALETRILHFYDIRSQPHREDAKHE